MVSINVISWVNRNGISNEMRYEILLISRALTVASSFDTPFSTFTFIAVTGLEA